MDSTRSAGDLAAESRNAALWGAWSRMPVARCLIAALGVLPLIAHAGDTWEFTDGDGVLHIGNVPDGVESTSSHARAHASEPDAVRPAARELRWINRTWNLRYPAWEPASVVTRTSSLGSGSVVGAAPKLPRGFNDVKPFLDAAAQSHAVDPALV